MDRRETGLCVSFTALLCFNSTATAVQNITVTVNPEEECQSAGKEFAAYFTPEYKDGKLYCVTPCMSGFNTSLDCHYGKCRLQRSGPQCLCLTTDTHWYTGETCDWGVQKSLVYGLLGAVGTVLLVALVVVLVFAILFKREAKRDHSEASEGQGQQVNPGDPELQGQLGELLFDQAIGLLNLTRGLGVVLGVESPRDGQVFTD
ncbi:mucin-17-like [Castor canadensis]|uniref:Mucin-17-like n=1 Tax=Castor canadensis TaxID=51338 RepID=A0AC58MWY7_CASCN